MAHESDITPPDAPSPGDRPIPFWWHLLLLLTIIAAVGLAAFEFLSPSALSPHQRWSVERYAHMQRVFSTIADIPPGNDKILMLMNDPRWRAAGAGIYALRCARCHGADGEGFIGPNLTDDHYKTVRTLTDLLAVVRDGSGGGTMPAQKFALSDSEITVVAAYVASLRGAHRPGPRPPEGEVIEPWPTPTR